MTNIDYLHYSQENPDSLIDLMNKDGVLVINRNVDEPETILMKENNRLLELITTYKTISSEYDISNVDVINAIIDKIIYILKNVKNINYSPFCCYFQVLGYSYYAYKQECEGLTKEENRELIKRILDCYISARYDIYSYHKITGVSLQVCSDLSSSRRKGKTGIEKMQDVLGLYGINRIDNYSDLYTKNCSYLLPDKGDKNEFEYFLQESKIEFKFRKLRDNKLPDMLLKIYNDVFIIEHKLTNGSGGSQNAELNEIIQFINYAEQSNFVHYVSCLQGEFFKKLNPNNSEPKIKTQYSNIIRYLENNTYNYFVNGSGFRKLIADFIQK